MDSSKEYGGEEHFSPDSHLCPFCGFWFYDYRMPSHLYTEHWGDINAAAKHYHNEESTETEGGESRVASVSSRSANRGWHAKMNGVSKLHDRLHRELTDTDAEQVLLYGISITDVDNNVTNNIEVEYVTSVTDTHLDKTDLEYHILALENEPDCYALNHVIDGEPSGLTLLTERATGTDSRDDN